MNFKFEHIESETSDEEWIEDIARLFASIIYTQMIEEMKNNEEAPDNI